jgi:hypothetical protein
MPSSKKDTEDQNKLPPDRQKLCDQWERADDSLLDAYSKTIAKQPDADPDLKSSGWVIK